MNGGGYGEGVLPAPEEREVQQFPSLPPPVACHPTAAGGAGPAAGCRMPAGMLGARRGLGSGGHTALWLG